MTSSAAARPVAAPSGVPELLLAPDVVAAVVAHARFCLPEEACGLLAVDGHGIVRMVYCLTNAAASATRFLVDPGEQYHAWRHAERNGWEIGGAFHSHPRGPAVPSPVDLAAANDPAGFHLLVGRPGTPRPELRAFRIRDGAAVELPLVTAR